MYAQLVGLCEQIACGNYEKAKEVFDLPLAGGGDTPTRVLAEAFAMMMVRIEAREFERERLVAEILSAREELERHRARLAVENRRLRAQVREQTSSLRIIGRDPAIQALLAQAERLALTRATLLITGETGAGKGVLARHIHDISPRAGKAFVVINCAAIPDTLLESELFGIEAGVASGVQARMGRFEQASGGTILLDEIGDMPLESQAKLLHVIEQGAVERVGGRKRIPVDVRIMAATHRNFASLVEQKTFREDLFYRLNVVQLHMPSLRERPNDISLLARAILSNLAAQDNGAPLRVSPEALALLMRYSWPGNIRELQNVLERATLLAGNGRITPEDLPPALLAGYVPETPARPEELKPACREFAAVSGEEPAQTGLTLEDAEADHIRRVLALNAGNKSHTARMLGISREGLRIKLARLHIA
jgi:DNA-binding NtrC family response regulator